MLLTLGLFTSGATAATLIWTNGSGLFSDTANWSPLPTAPASDNSTVFTNGDFINMDFGGRIK